jgi:hypothetical protein
VGAAGNARLPVRRHGVDCLKPLQRSLSDYKVEGRCLDARTGQGIQKEPASSARLKGLVGANRSGLKWEIVSPKEMVSPQA